MKICILYSSYEGSQSPFKDYDARLLVTPFLAGHEWEEHALRKASAVHELNLLAKQGFDVFLNFCDGAWDEDRAGHEVVLALEKLNVPFTGASSHFYEPTREMMKRACHYSGVETPRGISVETLDGLEQAAAHLRFPLIVKHPSSYNSVGLTRFSRISVMAELREQVKKMLDAYGGALVEEFVEGREFTALVVENAADPARPHVYDPVELCFPDGETFKHFDLKWIDYQTVSYRPCDDPALAARIKEVSAQFFAAMRGTGYGRCDLRVNAAGEIFMLEINPNCGVFYDEQEPGSADAILFNHQNGHADFLERLLQAAQRRKVSKKWRVYFDEQSKYGVYAVMPIAPGEVVEPYEEHAHYLVTLTHVLKHWDAEAQDAFARYAYPLTDETWVMWSSDPADWKPINHSCDPNTWLDGMDLVARRPIAAGEQLTMDYSTFMNERMPDFECYCGAPNCRKIVRGSDYLTDVVKPYGDHVSDYVRSRRKQIVE